jgi:hypothetical protein
MSIRFGHAPSLFISFALLIACVRAQQGQVASSSSSSSVTHGKKSAAQSESRLDAGSMSQGVYRNPTFGFTCKIPAGWVLRTEEMNSQEEGADAAGTKAKAAVGKTGKVLLAAFSRPPLAHGEDVNSSILIAAESAAAYPGLKEAAQYLGPVSEIAKDQGFDVVSEPYEFAVGPKTMAREDFQKDVATRVMLQSTLALLARGYAVSFTFIGGTEDEVQELIEGLSFSAGAKPSQH